jgi:hypothetical protein
MYQLIKENWLNSSPNARRGWAWYNEEENESAEMAMTRAVEIPQSKEELEETIRFAIKRDIFQLPVIQEALRVLVYYDLISVTYSERDITINPL